MKFSVSDLPFGSFSKAFLKALPMQYDIEIFYEFGTDHYWDYVLKDLKTRDGAERRFSIHGPCVAVNLADPAALPQGLDLEGAAALALRAAFTAAAAIVGTIAHNQFSFIIML